MPEPDVVIATIEREKIIVRESVRLAVEVSVSTLDFDLKRTVPLYAKAAIAELWIVDVAGRKIIRMADPVDGASRSVEDFAFGTRIACATIPEIAIDTTTSLDSARLGRYPHIIPKHRSPAALFAFAGAVRRYATR